MKTILIPTDFKHGIKAVTEVGMALSGIMDARLVFLYSIEPVSMATATPAYAFYETDQKVYKRDKKAALEQYTELFNRIKSRLKDDSYCELVIEKGDQQMNIETAVKHFDPDMILMADGHDGVMDILFGEPAYRVVQSVNRPVCLVPQEYSFTGLSSIAFLMEYSSRHMEVFNQATGFVKKSKARFCVLHPAGPNDVQTELLIEGFKHHVKDLLKGLKTDHYTYADPDGRTQLVRFLKDNHVDMLLLVNEDENWIQRWFRHSTADKLMDTLEIPIVIYPAGEG